MRQRDIVGLPRLLQTNGLHFICAAWINKADAAESVAAVASSTDLTILCHASPHFLIDFKMFQFV